MSNIITSLPVEVDSNNDIKTETRDRDIISASIEAPDINRNLLTQEYVMFSSDADYGSPFFKKGKDCFHYNFNYLPNVMTYYLLKIPLLSLYIKPNTKYTISLKFDNLIGVILRDTFRIVLIYDNNVITIRERFVPYNIGNVSSITFTTPNIKAEYYKIAWYKYDWINNSNCTFDLKIISLVEGDASLLAETENLYSYSKQSVITSNENNSLGSYQVSPYIRKHIQTIEHNIVKQENQYDINWR